MAGISNHFDTMTAIKAIIDGLALPDLSGGSVIQEVATYHDGTVPLPFISISPCGTERLRDELNDRDGTSYGVLVAIVAKPSINNLETRLAWRQTLRRSLNNRAIAHLGENYNLAVEPGETVEQQAWFDRHAFVSSLVVRAFFQEPRS